MAEEVKIVDVAGGPAAEATLQELLKVMKQMAAKSGKGSGADGEAQKLYNESVKKGTTVKKENTKAAEENTSALNKMSSAMGRLVGSVISGFTSIIGNGISIATNLFTAFADGTGTLTDMIGQIPIFGSLLARLTAPFDDTLRSFQQLSSSGASFNNDLTQLRAAAAGAKVSLETFTSFIAQNTEKFAMFGGTVTQGAEAFGRARRAMRGYEQDLLNMGLSFEEINEGLADYMAMQSGGSRAQQRDMARLAKESATYSANLMTLSKLTGQDVRAIRERQIAEQNDLAFQMRLSKMTATEREKVRLAMLEAEAAGPAAVARLKEEVLGFPPMTRETQLFVATMGAANRVIEERAAAIRDESVSSERFLEGQSSAQARILAGMLESAESMENVLTAGSLSGEGVGNEILQMLQRSGVNLSKYIGLTGEQLQSAIQTDIETAQRETRTRNNLVEGLTSFQNTLREVREAIELYIIGPIGRALGPQLTRLAEMFKSTNEQTLTPAIEAIGRIITRFTDDIDTFGFVGALKNLMTNIGEAARPVFESMINEIKGMLFGRSAEEVQTEMQETLNAINAQEERLTSRIAELRAQITREGLTGPELDAAEAEIAEYEAQLGRLRQQQAAVNQEMSNAEDTTGLLGGLFSGLWNRIKEMDWGSIALGIGGFTIALVALGKAATLVSPGLIGIGAAFGGIGLAGYGIAALIESITTGVGKLAEGLERMQELDAGKLLNVGQSLGPLTDNLMGLAAGGVIANFIGEGTFDNLARGLAALSEVPGYALSMVGEGIGGITRPLLELSGSGLILNFVGDNVFGNLAEQLKKFEDLNPETLHQVGPALVSLNQGIQAFTGGGILEGLGNAIGNFFSGLFGGNEFEDLVENLRMFETVDTRKIYEIGMGLQGIANFSDIDLGDIEIGSRDLQRLNNVMSSLDPGSITSYSNALASLVEVLTRLNEEMDDFTALNVNAAGTATPGVDGRTTSAGVLANIGGRSAGSSDQQLVKLDQLNTIMQALLEELQENTELNRRISRAVRGNNLQA